MRLFIMPWNTTGGQIDPRGAAPRRRIRGLQRLGVGRVLVVYESVHVDNGLRLG